MKRHLKNLLILSTTFLILTVIITADPPDENIFKERRSKFIEKMENGIAVLAGNKSINYSGDGYYDFRQNADFYYLTGYTRPDAILILAKGRENKSILFINEPSIYLQVYNGMEPSLEEIKNLYDFDEVYYTDKFDDILNKQPTGQNTIYYSFSDEDLNTKINDLFDSNYRKPKEIVNSEIITRDLRVIKSEKEIELLQKAIDITNVAHWETLKKTKPGMNESELQALIEYTFRINGSPRNVFPCIVGSGRNSCVLHYGENNNIINDNVTVVLDIGAEYGNYSADVTRTIPSNGKFTEEQKTIYNVVYDAQKQAIEMVKPGIKLTDVHNKTFKIIKDGLYKLGLVTDTSKNWQTKMWYPHGASHWLGIDAHDAGDYKFREGGRELEAGMVFTVEPGIYIGENILAIAEKMPDRFIPKDELGKFKDDIKEAFEKYKNIGIRIEDDILVTEKGHKNLSEGSPKTIEEIEKIMSASN
jgi:Xaa-Pro aminopeptidase